MATKWKHFKLLDIATISDQRVTHFAGEKDYVATGDIELNKITSNQRVSYDNRPSRADLIMDENDVLFAKMKDTVKVLVGSEDTENKIFSTGFYVLTPHKNVAKEFLYFYFLSVDFNRQKNLLCTGATMSGLNNVGLRKISLQLPIENDGTPDLAEQKRIVATLEETESLKKKRAEADQKMSELIPALFNKMFGDPTDNKMDWNTGVLGDVVHSAKDGPHVSPKYSDSSGIPFFSSRHVKPGEIIWEDLKYIELQEAQKQWKKCKPEKGDILYTKGGTTGVAAVVTFDTPIAVWVHIALLKTNHSKVNPFWLETMLNSAFCYKQSQELTHGIANRDLGLNRMKTIKIFLPPLDLQNEFAEKIREIKVQKENQRQSAIQLDGLFSSLLSLSFSRGFIKN